MYVRGCGFRWKNWGCHGLLRKNSVPLEPAPKRDDRHLVVLCLVLASPLVHNYAIVHCTSSSYVGWRTGLLQLLTLQLIDDNFPARILHSTCGHLVCTFPPTTSCTPYIRCTSATDRTRPSTDRGSTSAASGDRISSRSNAWANRLPYSSGLVGQLRGRRIT